MAQSVRNLSVSPALEDNAFDTYIRDLLIDPSTVENSTFEAFRRLYPANDSSLGGRFNTGDSLFDRAAAWYSDNMYLSPRRLLFDKAAGLQPSFAYFFTEFIPGNDLANGGKPLMIVSIFLLTLSSIPRIRARFALWTRTRSC